MHRNKQKLPGKIQPFARTMQPCFNSAALIGISETRIQAQLYDVNGRQGGCKQHCIAQVNAMTLNWSAEIQVPGNQDK